MKRRKAKGFGNPPSEKPSNIVLLSADADKAEALCVQTVLGKVTVDNLMPPTTGLAQSLNMPPDCILMPFLIEEEYQGILFTKKGFSQAVLLSNPPLEIQSKFADKAFLRQLIDLAGTLKHLGRWIKVKRGDV